MTSRPPRVEALFRAVAGSIPGGGESAAAEVAPAPAAPLPKESNPSTPATARAARARSVTPPPCIGIIPITFARFVLRRVFRSGGEGTTPPGESVSGGKLASSASIAFFSPVFFFRRAPVSALVSSSESEPRASESEPSTRSSSSPSSSDDDASLAAGSSAWSAATSARCSACARRCESSDSIRRTNGLCATGNRHANDETDGPCVSACARLDDADGGPLRSSRFLPGSRFEPPASRVADDDEDAAPLASPEDAAAAVAETLSPVSLLCSLESLAGPTAAPSSSSASPTAAARARRETRSSANQRVFSGSTPLSNS